MTPFLGEKPHGGGSYSPRAVLKAQAFAQAIVPTACQQQVRLSAYEPTSPLHGRSANHLDRFPPR